MIQSWTGSEDERSEQGVCLPPSRMSVSEPKLRIPSGTSVAVCRVFGDGSMLWKEHKTTRDLGFERYEQCSDGYLTFRESGYFIKVHRRNLKERK